MRTSGNNYLSRSKNNVENKMRVKKLNKMSKLQVKKKNKNKIMIHLMAKKE